MIQALAQNIKAEQEVLASILVDNEVMLDALEILEPGDFFSERNLILYTAMKKLYTEGKPIDMLTLMEFFNQDLSPIGGYSYISDLLAGGVRYNKEHAKIVKEKSNMRKLQKLLYKSLEASKDMGFDELLRKVQGVSLSLSQGEESTYVDDLKLMSMTLESIEENYKAGGGILGLRSGITILDRAINGFQKKRLYVIAGRPGMGKSAFALNLCQNMSKSCKIDYYSLEMSEEELGIRRVAMKSSIDTTKIERGNLSEEEWLRLTGTMGDISRGNCVTNCKPGIHVDEIFSRAKKRKLQEGLDLIIVDHIGYMDYKDLGDTIREQTSKVCLRFKNMAKELDIPIIILSQLSRGVEQRSSKRPLLSDLKESSGIEENADVVMLLYRDEYYDKDTQDKGVIECNIAKQRGGKTGKIRLGWKGEYQRIGE